MSTETTDFRAVVNDLLAADLTFAQIAANCLCTESYIRHLSKGERTSVGYEIGSRLLALHEETK